MRKIILTIVSLFSIAVLMVNAQTGTTVTGTVKNASSKETVGAVSISVKGSSYGTYTDDKGNFKLFSTQNPPFILVISSIGYDSKEVSIDKTGQVVNVELNPSYSLGQEVVVAASRLPERILESPVSIERISAANIRNAPGASYYDGLANLKGVDVTTSSYTFKTVSTRGFNGSGSLRFNQLIDGMDNTAPALNFSVGNIIGLTELDVDNMELLSGASSALYGSGGMNGTLLISSKNPFKYQGVSFQIKQGVMHLGDSRQKASPFYDWSVRWGKKVSEKFAFKIGAEYVKADDWQADDKTNLSRNNVLSNIKGGDRASDPNYDGVNVFGDEASASLQGIALAGVFGPSNTSLPLVIGALGINPLDGLDATEQGQILGFYSTQDPAIYGPLPIFSAGVLNGTYIDPSTGAPINASRTGYDEKDLVNYDTYNFKVSGGLYYKLNSNTEASLTGNWGNGTTVYTGSDRYSLKNFSMGQYKLEIKSKNWFLRAYTTQENSGDSYASTLAALSINNRWKSNGQWFGEYAANYAGAILFGGAPSDVAHSAARSAADIGRYLPGSSDFQRIFDSTITTPITGAGGAQFADKSDLYQAEGQLNLSQYVKFVDVLIGASVRQYNINSRGTIFADSAGAIKINEAGAYIQLQKSLFDDVLKLSASGRYDKNSNFDGRFTPRITASIRVAKDNNIRISYQQAYRFPSNQDQWINLTTPGTKLIGGLPEFATFYNFATNPVYTAESVAAFRTSRNPADLKQADFVPVKPESVQSLEVGYRGVISKKLLLDVYYYTSKYKDFIARVAVARGASNNPATSIPELASPFTTTNYSFVTNTSEDVKASGWGASLEYQLGKGYIINTNVYSDELRDIPANVVTFFNTPKYRFNFGLANPNFYKGLGFNAIYKWQDKVNWEGTFGSGEIPSFGTVDFQLSYKLPKTKNLIKFGATNIFNNYYRNAFGNPYVGGLYYVSFGYNVF